MRLADAGDSIGAVPCGDDRHGSTLLRMVRRDATGVLPSSGAGARPVPVSVGAPGSRLQVSEGDLRARAGRRKPVRRLLPRSGEQARRPQHQVKLAASTEEQFGSRAAHVTAKATSVAPVPKGAAGPGGVRSAACVQGKARNTRGPSASPSSGQGGTYKPKAKSCAVQRESEGIIVPKTVESSSGTNAVKNNAAGGKGPCCGHARNEGKREGMADEIGPNYPGARRCDVQVRQPQCGLWAGAKRQAALRAVRGPRARSEARARRSERGARLAVHASSRGPSVSRMREIRTYGSKGGPALSPVFTHQE